MITSHSMPCTSKLLSARWIPVLRHCTQSRIKDQSREMLFKVEEWFFLLLCRKQLCMVKQQPYLHFLLVFYGIYAALAQLRIHLKRKFWLGVGRFLYVRQLRINNKLMTPDLEPNPFHLGLMYIGELTQPSLLNKHVVKVCHKCDRTKTLH